MPLPEYESFSALDGAACHPWFKQAACHLTILLLERTATPTLQIRLHLCGNVREDSKVSIVPQEMTCVTTVTVEPKSTE
jgi:hypothetical protein